MASGESAGNLQAANGEAEAKMETKEQKGPVLCLDLTSYQLQDMSEVEIPTTLEEVNLTANRLTSVDPRIGRLAGLRKISFRQTLLDDDDVTPLSSWDTIVGLQVEEAREPAVGREGRPPMWGGKERLPGACRRGGDSIAVLGFSGGNDGKLMD